MSYIEKKYLQKILDIFNELKVISDDIGKMFRKKSIKEGDEIAKYCSKVNRQVNLILKKYYPEIKDMDDKLIIKATLKFYYDLIDKSTDFIRHIEHFRKIEDEYYDVIVEFIEEREELISNKYSRIARQELTSFYDQKSRKNLESVLKAKISARENQFFTYGPLEQEVKKRGKLAGADKVEIYTRKDFEKELGQTSLDGWINSIVRYSVNLNLHMIQNIVSKEEIKNLIDYHNRAIQKRKQVGKEISSYLKSKGFRSQNKVIKDEWGAIKRNSDMITETYFSLINLVNEFKKQSLDWESLTKLEEDTLKLKEQILKVNPGSKIRLYGMVNTDANLLQG